MTQTATIAPAPAQFALPSAAYVEGRDAATLGRSAMNPYRRALRAIPATGDNMGRSVVLNLADDWDKGFAAIIGPSGGQKDDN